MKMRVNFITWLKVKQKPGIFSIEDFFLAVFPPHITVIWGHFKPHFKVHFHLMFPLNIAAIA